MRKRKLKINVTKANYHFKHMRRSNEEFNVSEDKCWELLQDFIQNSNFRKKIVDYGRWKEKEYVDATGLTSDNQFINMELKKRNIAINQYPTLDAEGHKLADLYIDYFCDKKIPLYINFLKDWYVVVFNLAKLKHRHAAKKEKNWSQGYHAFEMTQTQKLDIKDAWIYKKDENGKYRLMQKGW